MAEEKLTAEGNIVGPRRFRRRRRRRRPGSRSSRQHFRNLLEFKQSRRAISLSLSKLAAWSDTCTCSSELSGVHNEYEQHAKSSVRKTKLVQMLRALDYHHGSDKLQLLFDRHLVGF